MEWLSAFFAAMWTLMLGAFARWTWIAPERWQSQGFFDNGLGTRIEFKNNPRAAIWLRLGMKVFAAYLALFAAFGFFITFGWIWKAL
jgi:hypothetical protein